MESNSLKNDVGRALRALLGFDGRQYWIVLIFAIQAGVFSLAIPLAVQLFVNNVVFIGTLEPILILSVVLLAVLGFSVSLQLLQLHTVEKLEQRAFGLNLARLLEKIPLLSANPDVPRSHLAMQFWELVSMQKNMKSILIEGLALGLQAVTGLILISFYHPWFLGFSVLLAFTLYALFKFTRSDSFRGRYELSSVKYEIANFSQDVARNAGLFQGLSAARHLQTSADKMIDRYLGARQSYFKTVMKQNLLLGCVYVLGSSILLGVGGYLVVQEQLALGQLVASEIVISALLYNVWKFGSKVESVDSFLVSIYKIDKILESSKLFSIGNAGIPDVNLSLRVNKVIHPMLSGTVSEPLQLELKPGSSLLILGKAGTGKSLISKLLAGDASPLSGTIELGGVDLRELRLEVLRENLIRFRREDILQASIEDNVRCLRPSATSNEVKRALELVGLLDYCSNFPQGLQTKIEMGDIRLGRQQKILLVVARALVAPTKVLIFDEILDGLEQGVRMKTIDALLQSSTDRIIIMSSIYPAHITQFSQVLNSPIRDVK